MTRPEPTELVYDFTRSVPESRGLGLEPEWCPVAPSAGLGVQVRNKFPECADLGAVLRRDSHAELFLDDPHERDRIHGGNTGIGKSAVKIWLAVQAKMFADQCSQAAFCCGHLWGALVKVNRCEPKNTFSGTKVARVSAPGSICEDSTGHGFNIHRNQRGFCRARTAWLKLPRMALAKLPKQFRRLYAGIGLKRGLDLVPNRFERILSSAPCWGFFVSLGGNRSRRYLRAVAADIPAASAAFSRGNPLPRTNRPGCRIV